jgi:threonine synthase
MAQKPLRRLTFRHIFQAMTNDARYINPRTGATWPTAEPLWCAPDDAGYVNLTPGPGLSPEQIDTGEHSLWRYREALRLGSPARTLGEGWTPLVDAEWDGLPVHMKAEFLMPSGSFKDRGVSVMLSYLKQCGIREILEDSSGNAGASVATYGAALGFACRIYVPASAPAPKRYQIAAMGAEVIPVPGTRDDVAQAARAASKTCFYAGHNLQPFFLEGTKTLAFELWEQFDFSVPDNIVIPCGQGSNVMGCHIGFRELLARGLIASLPRLFAIQAANAAPYYAAYVAGSDEPVEIEAKPTIADGIASARGVRVREVLQAVRETGGRCLAVREDEIVDALRRMTAQGFFVEPTTAAAGAGLSRLIADGDITAGQSTVVILTGSGLKAVETIGVSLGLSPT